ncbi:hypothetical protein BO94DRAFT_350926 [Aspergillus sclerotioniger CBS 115572]|uniref:Uncharacterized protein n=1 Tax=Aspergillus sclerotioniger CBS 115572 TaxID=1450535 RepID=A0A317X9Z9_9EURO|nr:hypothetical protein BO94DRAFT_350926 [Aspergillus sclerotioniger CBS 115572]PWY93738.1 hypothetical protein BO94DRAFT_350926 [Aspergillus sclerotioniger CBS 115572]
MYINRKKKLVSNLEGGLRLESVQSFFHVHIGAGYNYLTHWPGSGAGWATFLGLLFFFFPLLYIYTTDFGIYFSFISFFFFCHAWCFFWARPMGVGCNYQHRAK